MLKSSRVVCILACLAVCGCQFSVSRPSALKSPDKHTPVASGRENERADDGKTDAAPPRTTFHGTRDWNLSTYTVPESFRQRLSNLYPEAKLPSGDQRHFSVENQNLKIRRQDATMTFTGVLKVPGRQDENIELRCRFDVDEFPWACGGMVPTDLTVAKERRLQATAICYDPDRRPDPCQQLGVTLYVSVNGETRSLSYQREPFLVREAESGDLEEDSYTPPAVGGSSDSNYTPPAGGETSGSYQPPQDKSSQYRYVPPRSDQRGAPYSPPKMLEKPTRAESESDYPSPPATVPETIETEEELDQLLNNPNAAVDVTAPVSMPAPEVGEFSIPGIEKLTPQMGRGARVQAIGYHDAGELRDGNRLPMRGEGFFYRMNDNRNFGTDMTVDLLQKAAAAVDRAYPGQPPIVIGNISKKGGGHMCSAAGNCHASHQTGLDADIVFPSHRPVKEMWPPCRTTQIHKTRRGGRATMSTVCRRGSALASDFDDRRMWLFLKTLTCADKDPVIVVFVDRAIKQHICQYARQTGEPMESQTDCAFKTLSALKHSTGHQDHFHVRFKCPEGRRCRQRTWNLSTSTGC